MCFRTQDLWASCLCSCRSGVHHHYEVNNGTQVCENTNPEPAYTVWSYHNGPTYYECPLGHHYVTDWYTDLRFDEVMQSSADFVRWIGRTVNCVQITSDHTGEGHAERTTFEPRAFNDVDLNLVLELLDLRYRLVRRRAPDSRVYNGPPPDNDELRAIYANSRLVATGPPATAEDRSATADTVEPAGDLHSQTILDARVAADSFIRSRRERQEALIIGNATDQRSSPNASGTGVAANENSGGSDNEHVYARENGHRNSESSDEDP